MRCATWPELVTNYVAVWNESDATARRHRIRSVWASEGTTCHRLLDARGYDEIEARVTGSWDKWLREGRYVFRPKSAVAHHDVVKFEFVMVTVPDGTVEAKGLCFLLLDADGRIKHDYQFNPTAIDVNAVADDYLAMWNEPDPPSRDRRIARLWAGDGSLARDTGVATGHDAIGDAVARTRNGHDTTASVFASPGATQAHHGLVKFDWKAASGAWTDLLILDAVGQIRCGYQFAGAATGSGA